MRLLDRRRKMIMIPTQSLINKLSLCLLGLVLCLEFPAYAADGVMEIGKRKQLFINPSRTRSP